MVPCAFSASRIAAIEAEGQGESLRARIGIRVGLLLVVGTTACGLLPERFAVNAPIAQMLFGGAGETPEPGDLDRFRLPEGFSIGVYAEGIAPTARFLRFSEAGDLLVSTPRSGAIVLLERDANGDGRADGMRELVSGLNRPHGVEIRDGWLYVGETDAIARVRFDAAEAAVSESSQGSVVPVAANSRD